MTDTHPLGKYLHLAPLRPAALPHHPAFDVSEKQSVQDTQYQRPGADNFIRDILNEAAAFKEHRIGRTFKESGKKKSPPATAEVSQLHQTITVEELKRIARETNLSPNEYQKWPNAPEDWFARRSKHGDQAQAGTASWDEFKSGLKELHSEHEGDYTPDIYDTHLVLDWAEQIRDMRIDGYHGLNMRIFEMCHKLPPPLNPRVFSTLVVSAYLEPDAFIVAQIPVDTSGLDEALYSNGKNMTTRDDPLMRKKITLGLYTSIEYCQYDRNARETDWVMATASDAKGNLPMFTQKMGVPGAVLKDVGYFIGWCVKQRGSQDT